MRQRRPFCWVAGCWQRPLRPPQRRPLRSRCSSSTAAPATTARTGPAASPSTPCLRTASHADAEVWEKAVRKLRGRLMPPPGETQPDAEDHRLPSSPGWRPLDTAAAANPDPGYVGLHRLNRTEYAREIERVLGHRCRCEDAAAEGRLERGLRQHRRRRCASRRPSSTSTSRPRALVSRQAIGRATGKAEHATSTASTPPSTRTGMWMACRWARAAASRSSTISRPMASTCSTSASSCSWARDTSRRSTTRTT